MAKRMRLSIDRKGIGQMLKGEDAGSRLKATIASEMDKAQRKAEANLPRGVHVDRRDYVGHDRLRATMGVPGSVEARTGVLSRALGVTGKLKGR